MLFYRAILLLLAPFLTLKFLISLLRGRETWTGLRERLALESGDAPSAPRLWLHGASLGELTAARGVIDALIEHSNDLHLIITSNSYSARKMVKGWNLSRTKVRLAPLDYPAITARFIGYWRPRAYVTMENELWPVRTIAARDRAVPVVILSGRLSERSAKIWARFPRLANRIMGAISLLVPLDEANAERFARLGLPAEKIAAPLNLKAGVTLASPDPDELLAMQAVFRREATILAASTHPGDDEVVLDGFALARERRPDLRMILAPRHPERADQIAGLIEKAGLNLVRRSACPVPDRNFDVYLADTLGDMALLYSLAAQTLMCGSFSDRGGHSPVEPVQFGSFVLHGPDVSNHIDAYRALARAEAARQIENAHALAAYLCEPLSKAELAHAVSRARTALAGIKPESVQFDGIVDHLVTLVHDNATEARQD